MELILDEGKDGGWRMEDGGEMVGWRFEGSKYLGFNSTVHTFYECEIPYSCLL